MSVELCASASLGLEWPEPYLETTRDSWMHILNRTKVSKTPEALEAPSCYESYEKEKFGYLLNYSTVLFDFDFKARA